MGACPRPTLSGSQSPLSLVQGPTSLAGRYWARGPSAVSLSKQACAVPSVLPHGPQDAVPSPALSSQAVGGVCHPLPISQKLRLGVSGQVTFLRSHRPVGTAPGFSPHRCVCHSRTWWWAPLSHTHARSVTMWPGHCHPHTARSLPASHAVPFLCSGEPPLDFHEIPHLSFLFLSSFCL